jgi:hypothetical protein
MVVLESVGPALEAAKRPLRLARASEFRDLLDRE